MCEALQKFPYILYGGGNGAYKRGLFKKYENGSSHLPYIEKGKTAKVSQPIFTLLDESRQGYGYMYLILRFDSIVHGLG